MTRLDKKRIDRIEHEEWLHQHPDWWKTRALNILLAIASILIAILIFFWCSIARVKEVEAAVFHKETETILYVPPLDVSIEKSPGIPPEAIEVDISSPSDAEAEFEVSSNAQEKETEEENEWVSIGKFKCTFYCACRSCSGSYGHHTASGATCTEGITVAVDRRVIPLGTELMIDGIGYRVAQDTGVKGNWIDVFMESHSECLRNGVQYHEVYVRRK